MTFYNTCFLLNFVYQVFMFWKEFTKRARSDFWTNVTIGRLFNRWYQVTSFSYFFFFRSYISKLFNTIIFSKAFKFFNIFFFFWSNFYWTTIIFILIAFYFNLFYVLYFFTLTIWVILILFKAVFAIWCLDYA